jgi:hypothetical protein
MSLSFILYFFCRISRNGLSGLSTSESLLIPNSIDMK